MLPTIFRNINFRNINKLTNKYLLNFYRLLLLFCTASLPLSVYAQFDDNPPISLANPSTISAQTMLENIATQVPTIMQMVTALAYVLGMYFIFSGIMKLKHVGESRTMMSREHHLAIPLTYLAVGALLIYLPTSVQIGMSTFWTNPNPYGYLQEQDQWSDFLNDCFLIVQLIGTIAFIRGLVILGHVGEHGQQGQFSRGLTHIIGGIFCINIYQFVQVILLTLGIQT